MVDYQQMQKISLKRIILGLLPFVMILIICAANGLHNIDNANFFPMNGTYQNYNPWRRVMSGQVPFSDFVSLYGLGQIYAGSFLTWILGGSYADSMVAADFLSMFSTALIFFTVQYLITCDRKVSAYVTLILTSMISIVPTTWYLTMPAGLVSMVQIAQNNNNARMLRACIIAIVPLVVLGTFLFIIKKKEKGGAVEGQRFDMVFSRICGAAAIGGILWENCMGISMFVGTSFVWFLYIIKKCGKDITQLIILGSSYLLSGLITFGVMLLLLTKDGAITYIRNTFSMGGGFFWYTNNGPKIIHVSDIQFGKWTLIGICILIISVVLMFKADDRNKSVRFMLIASMYFAALFADHIYNWSSGGSRKDALIPLIVGTICAALVVLVRKAVLCKNIYSWQKLVFGIAVGVHFSVCFLQMIRLDDYSIRNTRQRGQYYEELGGYIDNFPRSRWAASAKDIEIGLNTIQDDSLFSTYSTAVDVITDRFQPSGFDYMIYALGDDNQSSYLSAFLENDAAFVQTMHPEYNPWDDWDKGQNLYFWNELYKKYVPWTRTSTSIYWKKADTTEKFSPKISINTEKISDSETIVTVTSDIQVPFVVFVNVDYACDTDSHLSTGLLRKMVEVEDISYKDIHRDIDDMQFGFYLPERGVRKIPVTVFYGTGQIKLSVYQAPEVILDVGNVTAAEAFRKPFQYAFCEDLTNGQYDHGVDADNNKMMIPNTFLNRTMFESARFIEKRNGERLCIEEVTEQENLLILSFSYNEDLSSLEYPNMFKIVTD